MDYRIVAQGKTVIPGVADDEEFILTDVSSELRQLAHHSVLSSFSCINISYFHFTAYCLLLRLIISVVHMRMSDVDECVDFTEVTMLTSRVSDYPSISHGKTRIPGVNDAEEFTLTAVSWELTQGASVLIRIFVNTALRNFWHTHLNFARSLPKFNETGFLHRFSIHEFFPTLESSTGTAPPLHPLLLKRRKCWLGGI